MGSATKNRFDFRKVSTLLESHDQLCSAPVGGMHFVAFAKELWWRFVVFAMKLSLSLIYSATLWVLLQNIFDFRKVGTLCKCMVLLSQHFWRWYFAAFAPQLFMHTMQCFSPGHLFLTSSIWNGTFSDTEIPYFWVDAVEMNRWIRLWILQECLNVIYEYDL
jgi:hypothetical protein